MFYFLMVFLTQTGIDKRKNLVIKFPYILSFNFVLGYHGVGLILNKLTSWFNYARKGACN